MSKKDKSFHVDRKVLSVSTLKETDETDIWWKKTPLERLDELGINRQIIYGYGSTPPRLQRFLEVADLKKNKKAAGRHKDLNDLEHLP